MSHIGDVSKMVAGPDLDRLVAERVMGWKWGVYNRQGVVMFGYTGDFAGIRPVCNFRPSEVYAHAIEAGEVLHAGAHKSDFVRNLIASGAPTLNEARDALAICHAALITVGVES